MKTFTAINRTIMSVLVAGGLVLGLFVAPSWATDSQAARNSLRGLSGVYVLIESLEPEVERAGLSKMQLKTDVELRLRQSGIRVLTEEDKYSVVGWPVLYVQVSILLHQDGLAAYNIDVQLCQKASLDTGERVPMARTWSEGSLGTIGSAKLSQLRGNVRDYVDQFINAYLSVNPRPAGSPAPTSTATSLASQPGRRTR